MSSLCEPIFGKQIKTQTQVESELPLTLLPLKKIFSFNFLPGIFPQPLPYVEGYLQESLWSPAPRASLLLWEGNEL